MLISMHLRLFAITFSLIIYMYSVFDDSMYEQAPMKVKNTLQILFVIISLAGVFSLEIVIICYTSALLARFENYLS